MSPLLAVKGDRPTGQFTGDSDGTWEYSPAILLGNLKAFDWEAIIGLVGPKTLSIEGAVEYSQGFRKALHEMVRAYPEIASFQLSFDGPKVPVAEVLAMGTGPADLRSVVFMHGTSDRFLDDIVESGLRPRGTRAAMYGSSVNASAGRTDAVYLTTQLGMARYAAREAARLTHGKPVILFLSGLRPSRLVPDEDSRESTALASLERMGSLAHVGTIEPQRLVDVKWI